MPHTEAGPAAAIAVHGLTKSYGGRRVLDGVDLVVPSGVYALLGANGAGKTTLVEILATLRRADGGRASICGAPLSDRAAIRRLVSVTGQFAAVDELLTTRENLLLVARLLGLSPRAAAARADELLADVDLTAAARRPVTALSGGMRRRLDLAMSLVVQPRVLFLDEPTTGLDPRSRRRVWDDVRRLAADGTTVLLTTQYLEEAEALADRIGVLAGGRLVAEGTAGELTARAGAAQVVLSTAAGEPVRTLTSDGTAAGLAAALDALAPDERDLVVELRRPTLEDAFTALTTDATQEDAA